MSWPGTFYSRRRYCFTNPGESPRTAAEIAGTDDYYDRFKNHSQPITVTYLYPMKSDFSDVRFYQGQKELSFVRSWFDDDSRLCYFYVFFPTLPLGGDICFYMYWGDASLVSDDDISAFEFCDDFWDSDIDTGLWTVVSPDTDDISAAGYGRRVTTTQGLDQASNHIYGSETFGPGTEIVFRVAMSAAYYWTSSPSPGYWTLATNYRETVFGLSNVVLPRGSGDAIYFTQLQTAQNAVSRIETGSLSDGFGPVTVSLHDFLLGNESPEWHEYIIQWKTGRIRFYIDRTLVHETTDTDYIPTATDLFPLILNYGWLFNRYWQDQYAFVLVRNIHSSVDVDEPTLTEGDIEYREADLANRIFCLGDSPPYMFDDSKTANRGTATVYEPGAGKIAFVSGTPATITDSDESFITTGGLASGDIIRVRGAAQNDGLYHVATAAEGTLTLHAKHALTSNTPAGSVVISTVAAKGVLAESISGETVEEGGRPVLRYALMAGGI